MSTITKGRIALAALAAIVAAFGGFAAPVAADIPFVVESIDGLAGWHTSIAMDPARGEPAISFQRGHSLMYATRRGGAWSVQSVDPRIGLHRAYTSLAFNHSPGSATCPLPFARPHISYFDETHGLLKYATSNGVAWTTEIVDHGLGETGGYTSLALDESNRPHIAYFDAVHGAVKYAVRTPRGWKYAIVAPNIGHLSGYTSLAISNREAPVIAYYDQLHGTLMLAQRIHGEWHREPVLVGISRHGIWSSVGLEGPLDPCVVSYDGDHGIVRCADRMETGWDIDVVSNALGTPGECVALRLDGTGTRHIAFCDRTNGNLMYAVGHHGAWDLSLVTAPGNLAIQLSLALDANANPHFSFYDWTEGALKYARPLHPWALAEHVEEGPKAGTTATLALDGLSGLRIAPNPIVRGMAEVQFRVSAPTRVELSIYDVEGRRVRMLTSENVSAGMKTIGWDARDDEGRAVAAGVYFLRLQAGVKGETKRITLLR